MPTSEAAIGAHALLSANSSEFASPRVCLVPIMVVQGAFDADQNLPFSFGLANGRVAAARTKRIVELRFEQVSREILDEDLSEILRNNPPDVVYAAVRDAFFQGAIRMFQRVNETRNIVLINAEARDKTMRHFFVIVLRYVRGNPWAGTLGT